MTSHKFTETEQSLASFLKECRALSELFTQSKNPASAFKLAAILELLHQKRLSVPDNLRNSVIKTIFQIHDRALHRSIPLIKQQAQISTIIGFLKENPVNDIKTMNQVLNRVVLADYTKNMLPTAKRLATIALDLYSRVDYQAQDPNLIFANKLKFLIRSIDLNQPRKNITDRRWLHENAQKLAQSNPVFQSFADQYPEPKKQQRISLFSNRPHALGEAPDIYSWTIKQDLYSK